MKCGLHGVFSRKAWHSYNYITTCHVTIIHRLVLPKEAMKWCLRKLKASWNAAKDRDFSYMGSEIKTSLSWWNSWMALPWLLVAAAYPRSRKTYILDATIHKVYRKSLCFYSHYIHDSYNIYRQSALIYKLNHMWRGIFRFTRNALGSNSLCRYLY